MKRKQWLSLFCAACMILSLCACGSKAKHSQDGDAPLEVSLWISKGEDSSYYLSYEENPVVKYLETVDFNGQKIDLRFIVPITGAEMDNFNTLISTEEYTDIMDMSFSSMGAAELLQDGYIWDLTPYMEQYMPNYMATLAAYPDLAEYVYASVDGEKKILSIYGLTAEKRGTFMGYLYRRDWIVQYGANPSTGAAFTAGYKEPGNQNTYYDDVVFPSGGNEPIYISDWEWMFDIFSKALAAEGITDGYSLSPYFKGYNEDGALYSGFGGGTPMWNRTASGDAAFGGNSDSMRAYLQCLNTWYEKGWLDKNFAEHTSDAAYSIDSAKVHSGKVAMWIGREAEIGAQMDTGDGFTAGVVVFGARQPINDVYGDKEQQGKLPNSSYQNSRIRASVTVSKKVTEENLPTILSLLDYFYSPEGGALVTFGLTKEQLAATQDDAYTKFGLTDGAYYTEAQADGSTKYVRNPVVLADNNLGNAMSGARLSIGLQAIGFAEALDASKEPYIKTAKAEWSYYDSVGYIDKSVQSQFSTDESNAYAKVYANLTTFMSTNLPKFITGQLDIDSDKDWQDYCTMLNKYAPEKVTKIYQRIFDSLS